MVGTVNALNLREDGVRSTNRGSSLPPRNPKFPTPMHPEIFELKQVGLCLTEPTLVYLAGLDSKTMWEARGLTGHDQDKALQKKLEEEKVAALADLKNSEAGRKKIESFTHECREVMKAILLGHYDWLDQYLGDRQIVLLCGLHRSGGSYLLDEISTIYDFPYRDYHCMHDDLPTFFPILYWKWPHYYLQYIAEFAQWLVIVRRSVPWKIVVKKRALWTFAIESLAHVFRDRLSIHLHVRHPISWAWADTALREGKQRAHGVTVVPSMQQYVQIYGRPLAGNETPLQLMMHFWRLFHTESARKNVRMSVLPFGNYGDALEQLARAHKPGYQPDTFNPTQRDYSQYADHYDEATRIIDDVRTHWAQLGLDFPSLDLI